MKNARSRCSCLAVLAAASIGWTSSTRADPPLHDEAKVGRVLVGRWAASCPDSKAFTFAADGDLTIASADGQILSGTFREDGAYSGDGHGGGYPNFSNKGAVAISDHDHMTVKYVWQIPPHQGPEHAESCTATRVAAEPDGDKRTRWDATEDFCKDKNPCGAWTYGYTRRLGSAPLVAYSAVVTWHGGLVTGWDDPANATSHAPYVAKNVSPTTWDESGNMVQPGDRRAAIVPGQLFANPGPHGEYSTTRWTAPRAGTYSFAVQFLFGDRGGTDVAVL